MKHLFIPYELALMAKEKGFDETCLAEFTILKGEQRLHLNNHLFTNEKIALNVPAPLYQQIIDWLFEQHQIFVTIIQSPIDNFGFIGRINQFDCTSKGEYYPILIETIKQALKLTKEIIGFKPNLLNL